MSTPNRVSFIMPSIIRYPAIIPVIVSRFEKKRNPLVLDIKTVGKGNFWLILVLKSTKKDLCIIAGVEKFLGKNVLKSTVYSYRFIAINEHFQVIFDDKITNLKLLCRDLTLQIQIEHD